MKNLFIAATFIILFSCKESPEFITIQKVNPNLYTINTGTSFYSCNPNNLDLCIEESKDFMPPIIRFPGGLDASFYHMEGRGYGYRRPPNGESEDQRTSQDEDQNSSDETRSSFGNSDDVDQRLSNSTDETLRNSPDNDANCNKLKKAYHFDKVKRKPYLDQRDARYPTNENVIHNVINYCKKTSSKILFTCNMMDATYNDNKRVIETIQGAGIEIVGIELGNEMYLQTFQCLKYHNVKTYIDTAKMYTTNLRNDFPSIKIGIVAAPSKIIGINPKRLEYYNTWNEAIKKETFYDAYIVHHYMKDKSCDCENGFSTKDSLKSNMDCHQVSLNNELKTWFGDSGIVAYKKLFPDKKMWLTEWSSTNVFKCYGNTQASNLFYAAYQNELVKYGDHIEFATFHNWLGRGKHFPMLAPKGNTFEKRSSSLVFSMLKPLFSKRETYELKIPQQLAESMPDSLKIYAYHQPQTPDNKGYVIVFIVNPNGADHTQKIYTDVITIDGKQYKLNKGKYTMSHSRTLAASLGNPGFGDATESILTEPGDVTSTIKLKGYSFTKITYELD